MKKKNVTKFNLSWPIFNDSDYEYKIKIQFNKVNQKFFIPYKIHRKKSTKKTK